MSENKLFELADDLMAKATGGAGYTSGNAVADFLHKVVYLANGADFKDTAILNQIVAMAKEFMGKKADRTALEKVLALVSQVTNERHRATLEKETQKLMEQL